MSLARLVITAVTVEGRTKSEVARDYGITRFWVQTLVKRFAVEGEAAFEPHSRRPQSNPRAVSLGVEAKSSDSARPSPRRAWTPARRLSPPTWPRPGWIRCPPCRRSGRS
jgi:transposase